MSLLVGTPVKIRAADDFYAFVDGWTGVVSGQQAGVAVVKCSSAEGEKTFFVPWDQLERLPS